LGENQKTEHSGTTDNKHWVYFICF